MRVAFPTNNEEKIAKHIGLCKKIVIYANGQKVEVIENPILKERERHLGTGRILSQFLSKKNVDILAALEFHSQGLKQNLECLAITPYETQERDIEKVLDILSKESVLSDVERGYRRNRGMNRKKGSAIVQGRAQEKNQRRCQGKKFGRGAGNQ